MTVQVLHALTPTISPDETTTYRSVGLVETPPGLTKLEQLEHAFEVTQNFEGQTWAEDCFRSTSVGDRMWIENELWQVSGIGFVEVADAS